MTFLKRKLGLAVVGIGFALCASARDPEEVRRVTFDGYGPVRIGMTAGQLEDALGGKLTYLAGTEKGTCRYADLGGDLRGASAMMIGDRLVRIDFKADTIETLSGIGIGDTVPKLLDAYRRRIYPTPHARKAPGRSDYMLLSADRKRGIRFETDRNIITTFYVGDNEAIKYTDGCP